MYQIYQIMAGETLESIANKFFTTPDDLISINGLNKPINLVPGNYLVVPKMKDNFFDKYIVKKGDNLYSIASRLGVDINVLEQINGLEKGAYIYPNQELLIPKDGYSYYVTESETLEKISQKSGVDLKRLVEQNSRLIVEPDQIVIYKEEKNE